MPAPANAVTLAVLTDVHYGAAGALAQRRSEMADILLLRAVMRLNRLVKPDVTLVLGDVLDDGAAPGAPERLAHVRTILDELDSPYLVIPGNHDGDPEAFYRVFDRPGDVVDLCGVRFLPFVDAEEPGYNASRRPVDLARFQQARAEYDGPIVALQHVCLAPPERVLAPYNYTNAGEIVRAMRDAGVVLSVSGHHHPGTPDLRNDTTTFVTAPGLCESPFPYLLITLDRDQVTTAHRQLAMPEHLGLVDTHVHTELAYCSDKMTVEAAIALARDFGLAGIGFAEHSGQLYFEARRYWSGECLQQGIAGARLEDERMPAYVALRERYARPGVRFGLEVDCDFRGDLLLKPRDRQGFDYLIGAIHRLPGLTRPAPPVETLVDVYLGLLARLLRNGIDILAHPFRVFHWAGLVPPQALFPPVVRLLREAGVAAELNFHANQPPLAFVREGLASGVRFAFGSDAHRPHEIGELADHLALLEAAGFDGDLADVLVPLNRA